MEKHVVEYMDFKRLSICMDLWRYINIVAGRYQYGQYYLPHEGGLMSLPQSITERVKGP